MVRGAHEGMRCSAGNGVWERFREAMAELARVNSSSSAALRSPVHSHALNLPPKNSEHCPAFAHPLQLATS